MKWSELKNVCKVSWLIMGRTSVQQGALLVYMPGEYGRSWLDKNVKVSETVTITELSLQGDLYQISRRTSEEIKDSELGSTVNRSMTETWMGVFNSSAKILWELGGERHCAFFPENQQLFIGKDRYDRL